VSLIPLTIVSSEDIARLLEVRKPCSRAALGSALSPKHKLAEVLISTARLEGRNVGALGESFLHNHSRRERFYSEMTALLPLNCRVLKGSRVSRFYPAGVARGLVDLDVWCADEASLWEAAAAVGGFFDTDVALAMWGSSSDPHLVVAYDRPSESTDFETGYRIELSTTALPGDFSMVPTMEMVELPRDVVESPILDLLLVAAEQHQRDVIGRDVVDAAYLLAACDPVRNLVALRSGARAMQLAEATRALLGHWLVRKYVPWAEQWARALESAEANSGSRRQNRVSLPVQGIYLQLPAAVAEAPPPPRSEVRNGVLCTPIGPFGLTSASEISADWIVERLTAATAAWSGYVSREQLVERDRADGHEGNRSSSR